MDHALSEFVRLLTVAGMEVPVDYHGRQDKIDENNDHRGGRLGQRGKGGGQTMDAVQSLPP